ncbi:MAG: hypothetical protein A4E48_00148 [Methanosaeta sp. PtaU1.Bin060]|nr:MAG: hypothetical protein A4E48_00148 [Methanosaeta sp. PtaU1.Bin060]
MEPVSSLALSTKARFMICSEKPVTTKLTLTLTSPPGGNGSPRRLFQVRLFSVRKSHAMADPASLSQAGLESFGARSWLGYISTKGSSVMFVWPVLMIVMIYVTVLPSSMLSGSMLGSSDFCSEKLPAPSGRMRSVLWLLLMQSSAPLLTSMFTVTSFGSSTWGAVHWNDALSDVWGRPSVTVQK